MRSSARLPGIAGRRVTGGKEQIVARLRIFEDCGSTADRPQLQTIGTKTTLPLLLKWLMVLFRHDGAGAGGGVSMQPVLLP